MYWNVNVYKGFKRFEKLSNYYKKIKFILLRNYPIC